MVDVIILPLEVVMAHLTSLLLMGMKIGHSLAESRARQGKGDGRIDLDILPEEVRGEGEKLKKKVDGTHRLQVVRVVLRDTRRYKLMLDGTHRLRLQEQLRGFLLDTIFPLEVRARTGLSLADLRAKLEKEAGKVDLDILLENDMEQEMVDGTPKPHLHKIVALRFRNAVALYAETCPQSTTPTIKAVVGAHPLNLHIIPQGRRNRDIIVLVMMMIMMMDGAMPRSKAIGEMLLARHKMVVYGVIMADQVLALNG